MSPMRHIEFLGGPWHGSTLNVSDEVVSLSIRDGARLVVYERGELVEGPKVREVFRMVGVVPGRA